MKAGSTAKKYVVTTYSKTPDSANMPTARRSGDFQVLRSEVWDSSSPLPVGYPFRWVLENSASGLRVRRLDAKDGAPLSKSFEEIPASDLGGRSQIRLPGDDSRGNKTPSVWLRIHPVQSLARAASRPAFVPKVISADSISDTEADVYFKKALLGTLGALALILLVASLIPKPAPKEEELIPPQFAKILLHPAAPSSSQSLASAGAASSKENNLVKAFRSQALQKSAQHLIKGGALALLRRSDLLGGLGGKAAVNSIFGAKSMLNPNSMLASAAHGPQSERVGMVGGEGKGGYGKGNAVSITGQGSGFVELDTREGSSGNDGLTREEIGKVINGHLSEIRYCNDAAQIRNPNIQGRITMAFTIGASGAVKSASIAESSVNDALLDQCVLSRLLTWKFPKPRGGVNVGVKFPFIFTTLH